MKHDLSQKNYQKYKFFFVIMNFFIKKAYLK